MSVVLDTHAAIWYLLDDPQLPAAIGSLIDKAAATGNPSVLSAISLVEIVYLAERGRIPSSAYHSFLAELKRDNAAFTVAPLDTNVVEQLPNIPRQAVPDMPDRIIAATALCLKLPLVTRDRRLQSAGIQTIW